MRPLRWLGPVPVLPAAILVAATACHLSGPEMVDVACSSLSGPEVTPVDTLDVLVRLDSLPPGHPGRLLVRVDPPEGEGLVRFPPTAPRTVAAVGLTLGTAGVFQGCAGEAPAGFLLQARRAPRNKAWLRVAAGRPVRIRMEGRGGGGSVWQDVLDTALVVTPGASTDARWHGGEPGR